ncbi:MAG: 16S rRNA (adenine(1518)-N(6)/adenine(1519)-N(6))-dimethyltransferase RsmA [bacterium]|nr:16S rRNA (adenine(1518)-N(6)/adenine(1519)-N(6))-dimethyltransferase RsmA [bacterium]
MGRFLGQHFLKDLNIRDKIIAAAQLTDKDRILEIGPGKGVLTEQLLQRSEAVTAIELDSSLAQALRALPKLNLIEGDILGLDLTEILQGSEQQPALPRSWKVVANLPYYITSPILEKLLCSSGDYLDYIVVMIQKEVAERLASIAQRQTSSLSYFVNYYASVEYLFTVKPGCFAPPPKVDSAVVRLTMRRQPPVSAPPPALFKVIRTAFQERRKTLRRSLLKLPGPITSYQWGTIWQQADIDPQRRPETLSLEEFSNLTEAIIQQAERN